MKELMLFFIALLGMLGLILCDGENIGLLGFISAVCFFVCGSWFLYALNS